MFSQKEDTVCRNIPLAVSQSTSVEQHDELIADGAIPMSNVVSGDATNSSSFLSVLIAGRILEERRDDDLPSINAALDEWQFFCENVNNLILAMPDHLNRYRDINRMYDVHEAYTILHKANTIKESYELFEEIIASSKLFTKKGRSSLSKALGKLAESSVAKVSIYTCGIIYLWLVVEIQFTQNVFEVVHANQMEELHSAIAGLSDVYILAAHARYLQVPADVWFEWTPKMREKYVLDVQKHFIADVFKQKDVPWPEAESADINTTEFRPLEEDIVTDLISGNGYSEENASALKKEVLTSS